MREHNDVDVVAWTMREGPGQPPAAPGRGLALALAAILATTFSAMLFTDSLCPEHRAWVQGLATVAIAGVIVSIVGLVRARAYAPVWALASALCGVAIGLLDAAHAAARGRLVAAAFALVAAGAAWLVARQVRLQRWQHEVASDLASSVDERALSANDQRHDSTTEESAAEPTTHLR